MVVAVGDERIHPCRRNPTRCAFDYHRPVRGAPILRLRGLVVDRPDGVRVLDGVDLQVRRGEVIALLGGSGAGKSTLLTCIEDPARLRAQGFRVALEERELDAEVGIVPQRGALFDHLSVAGNLELAMRNASARGDRDVAAWLERMHLPKDWARGRQGTARLSGGEAQRVAVARTLAGGRELLFLDEPSVGIDPFRVLVLAALLREQIQERNAAAIVVTHDLAFAAAFADRFWFMDRTVRGVVDLDVGEVPDTVTRSTADVRRLEHALSEAVVQRLEQDAPPEPGHRPRNVLKKVRGFASLLLDPFAVQEFKR